MLKKLRLITSSEKEARTINLEEAKDWDYYEVLVVVEKQLIHSFEELVAVASSESFKNKETLDVNLILFITGG